MVEILNIEHLNFTYAGADAPALRDVSLSVGQGEFVLLCGPSGCGKTTLLRLLKRRLCPHGERGGRLTFDGRSMDSLEERSAAADIGYVMQNPDGQMVCESVFGELAFGMESLGWDGQLMRRRMAEICGFFGMSEWLHQSTHALSGGQKQKLALASVMAMQPRLLLLDEPTAQLDPIAATELLQLLRKINEELGVTVIVAEHRLEQLFSLCDRVVLMREGQIVSACPPRALADRLDENTAHEIGLPCAVQMFTALGGAQACPLNVREARTAYGDVLTRAKTVPDAAKTATAPILMQAKDVWFRYERNTPDVLRELDLDIRQGELLCILGANGAGKTTLLRVLRGHARPYRGKLMLDGRPLTEALKQAPRRMVVLPQDPTTLFVKDTVREELDEVLALMGVDRKEWQGRREEVMHTVGLSPLLDGRHPYDLSGGEVQKAALAKLLLCSPEILLLDEPTKGMDACSKQHLSAIVQGLREQGKTVVMVTHDVEFAAAHAERCAMFFDGRIVACEDVNTFFTQNTEYTTAAVRICRGYEVGAVTTEQLINACRKVGDGEGELT